jgi:hypothetical protein
MEISIELASENQRWNFNKPEIKIGRDSGCDVRLPGEKFPMVSRLHATLRVEKGNCMVEDANSPNGIFLNGKRVQWAKVMTADAVRFGNDGPELIVRFVPEKDGAAIPATLAGPAAEKQFRSVAQSMVPKEAVASANPEMILLEKKLATMQKLLSATLAVVVVLGILTIYQGYMINHTEETLIQMRRQATDAVAQFMPTLDQKIGNFEKRADEMQGLVNGFDQKVKETEDQLVHRMEKEIPAVMDQYIQQKINEVRRTGK